MCTTLLAIQNGYTEQLLKEGVKKVGEVAYLYT